MSFTATQALNDSMLVGGVNAALDDHASNHAYAILYDAAAVALVTMLFTRPAVTLVAHELVFDQDSASGDMILVQGNAVTFNLYSAAGVLLGAGDVTDMAGAGPLKISGTTGTLLYAGARAILGEMKIV